MIICLLYLYLLKNITLWQEEKVVLLLNRSQTKIGHYYLKMSIMSYKQPLRRPNKEMEELVFMI